MQIKKKKKKLNCRKETKINIKINSYSYDVLLLIKIRINIKCINRQLSDICQTRLQIKRGIIHCVYALSIR